MWTYLYHFFFSLSLSPLSIYLSTYLSIYLSIYLSHHPSIYLSIYLSIHVQTAYQELAAELEKQTPNPWDLDNWEARLSRSRMRSWELGCTNGWIGMELRVNPSSDVIPGETLPFFFGLRSSFQALWWEWWLFDAGNDSAMLGHTPNSVCD